LAKNLSAEALRVVVRVAGEGRVFVDTVDLISARQRAGFVKAAAVELGVKEDVVRDDLAKLLLVLEEAQERLLTVELGKSRRGPEAPASSPEVEREALAFLRRPDLIAAILEDFATAGVVGEATNTLVAYLAAVSRLLDKPLAVLVESSSAAGKSALLEAVLAMVPEEHRVQYSAMTGQSLFYMADIDLKHKVLAIAEEEGAQRASYALKLLQSEGRLSIASTGKDPQSGRLVTQEYTVEGPVAILSTTTSIDVDEELRNRCLVLTVDEGREQTRAIQRLQREEETLSGQLRLRRRPRVWAKHHAAQRLLRPVLVVNPFAEDLTFLDDRTRTRRDHKKYLVLIRAIALLHQYQREKKRGVDDDGAEVEYIEASLDDVATANRLAAEVFGRTLDELPAQTRRFLDLLHAWAKGECGRQGIEPSSFRFLRRDARAATGWSYFQVEKHLDRLLSLEYVLAHRGSRGQSFEYELLWDGQGADGAPFVMQLADVEALRRKAAGAESLSPLEPSLSPQGLNLEPPFSPHKAPIRPPSSPPPQSSRPNNGRRLHTAEPPLLGKAQIRAAVAPAAGDARHG
jgi:hypothetical protein